MRRRAPRSVTTVAWLLVAGLWGSATARAEDGPAPPSAPAPPDEPKPAPPVAPAAPKDPKAKKVRAESVEDRLDRLEATNEELLEMVRELTRQNAELRTRLEQDPPGLDRSLEGGVDSIENPVPAPELPSATLPGPPPDDAGSLSLGDLVGSPGGLDRSLEGGVDSIENPVPGDNSSWVDGRVRIGPGFMLESQSGEFQLQFHNQTQVEARIYQQGGMFPAASSIDIPRQRFIFNGRFTRNIEFDASVEAAYGTINLLNAFLNFKPLGDDRMMFKAGRYKVPYLYEYYAISNADLLTPERSLFGINFGFNRMPGLMTWGSVADKRIDYAAGVFTGARNQFIDYNNDKDVVAYLNFKPFLESEGLPWLKNLNVGGSVNAGSQDNQVVPRALKTSVSQSTNNLLDNFAPSWLIFNLDARERGWRSFYGLHAAYFYRGLSVMGEWAGGFQDYGLLGQPTNTRVPIDSYYVAAGYFLTGEQVERRTQVKPLHNFSLRPGHVGPGAWELVGRYSWIGLGDEVFTGNLANPDNWTNTAYATDIGFNWYWNPYLKVYMVWQHSVFGDPVVFNSITGAKELTSDLFWLRFQFVY